MIDNIDITIKILDFRFNIELFQNFDRHLFNVFVYNTNQKTFDFHRIIRDFSNICEYTKFTKFHHTLKKLVIKNWLIRFYNQNIDKLNAKSKIVQLHNNLNRIKYQFCHVVFKLNISFFVNFVISFCKNCQIKKNERVNESKKQRDIDRLKSQIFLYEKYNFFEKKVDICIAKNLTMRLDFVLVIDINLRVSIVRRFVQNFRKILVFDSSILMWLNIENSKKKFQR